VVEHDLTAARKQLADLQLEAERARGRLEYQLKQVQQIEQRLATAQNDSRLLERQQTETAAELEQHKNQLGGLQEELDAARAALNEKAAERQQAQSHLAERERGLESLRQQVLRLLSDGSSLKSRVSQTEAQIASLEKEAARAHNEEQQSTSDLERIERVKRELSNRLAARQTELTSVAEERQEVEQSLQSKRAALQSSRQTLERVRSEFSRVKARRDSLEEIISHRSYTTETVKRIFTAIQKGQGNSLAPVGVLADFVEVDPRYEKAAEEFLHEELEYVVVRDWADAERGIDLLRNGIDGRATFLVEKTGEASTSNTDEAPLDSQEGIVGRLSDSMRFSNGLSSAPRDLLPRVFNCYIAADREAAQRLALHYPDRWFLSPDGVSYHGHSASGGKKTSAGPLALKRELREVSQLEKAKQQELTATQTQVADLEREIATLSEHLEVLRHRQQTQEKDVLALDHETKKLAEEFQRANTRLSSARLELDRVKRERSTLEESLASLGTQLAAKEAERESQESALEQQREEMQDLQGAVARVTEEHATLRANLAGFEERYRSTESARTRLEARLRELIQRLEALENDARRLSGEREHLLTSNTELTSKSEELKEQIRAHSSVVDQLAAKESELRAQIGAAEEGLKTLRQQVHSLQEKRSELQVAMARFESDSKHLDETSRNELQIPVQELASGVETVPAEAETVELESKYQEVRRKIEALGPVNPQALEEYEEAQQRQEFLNVQRQDLLDSIRDTEKAIQEIDAESRKRFTEAFHVINSNFKEMFKTLFGGGLAEMRLTDEENVSESGIEIVASPPGKKLQSVLLLSGGEKALTAMALLMAVFQYTPSPFCILDEVDAPLDEPNIQRLTRLLHTMSEQTQFIVITHAKRTMEAAQSLYGVTMQEPGVSRLVSVKFKSMEEVERNRAAAQAAREAKERERELVMA
jgi:chromosome segregation protein